jgi:4-hydroxyphenylpyruvate dioxygenase
MYRQGDIRLVVNAQPDSLARARFEAHGATVCAMGLATPEPALAASRAAALLSARYDSPLGADEMKLPAIIAPGGMVLHFVPDDGRAAFDEIDFIPEDKASDEAPLLQTIDHVALGMPRDQLDTWVLFCRSVLGLAPGDSLELADPFGLIRTAGFADAQRRLRMVLNVSLSQRTRTARTVHDSGGSGVHHIAFGCDDIFATIAALKARGTLFVPISPNYYDDLVTRFDIAPEFAERLRTLGILFDRSADGDYLHIYSESFADRFFFEIVQRVDGYDAYGALNAPARMASEAQTVTAS